MMRALTVEVVSDVVCPWCRIGKAHLDAALAAWAVQQPERPVQVRWHPYFLAPDLPTGGVPYHDFMRRKFGSQAAVDALFARVLAAAPARLPAFRFDRIAQRPNTLAAHRLIDAAQQRRGNADAIVTALFEAFFVEGRDVGDLDTLAELAAAAGEDRNATRALLQSDAGVAEVRASAAALAGVGGVPLFVVAGGRPLAGAVPAEQLLAELVRAAARADAATSGRQGDQ